MHPSVTTAALTAFLLVGCQVFRPPAVVLPADAPLQRSDCGWADLTALAFAGWATLAELGLPDRHGVFGSQERVFAIVTRDRIEQPLLGAPGVVDGRGICARQADGSIAQSSVADDWRPRLRE